MQTKPMSFIISFLLMSSGVAMAQEEATKLSTEEMEKVLRVLGVNPDSKDLKEALQSGDLQKIQEVLLKQSQNSTELPFVMSSFDIGGGK